MTSRLNAYLKGILRERRAEKEARLRRSNIVNQAIERAIEGTDKSIRLALGYQRKLFQAAEYCLDYADRLVDSIPPAMEFSKQAFARDPRINAFFVNSDALQNAFSHSSELQDFLESPENRGLTECCALLCMKKTEKNVFGMQLVGDMVQRDIAQTNVNFNDHQISWPAAVEADTRISLKQCLFDGVVTSVLERMSANRALKKELDQQRYLLKKKLQTLEHAAPDPAEAAERHIQFEQARSRLETIESQRWRAGRNTPVDYLNQLKYALGHPEELVRLKMTSLTLSRLGVKIPEDSAQKGDRIDLAEVEIGKSDSRVVVLAKFPTNEIQPPKDLVEEAARYLSV